MGCEIGEVNNNYVDVMVIDTHYPKLCCRPNTLIPRHFISCEPPLKRLLCVFGVYSRFVTGVSLLFG